MQVAEDRSTMIHYYRDRQRPPHRPTGLWIAGSIVAVVIVVLAAVLIVQHTGDTFDGRAVAASSHGDVVFKSASGLRSVVQRFGADDAGRLDAIRTCPVQFQEYVAGINVRVHVIGTHCFPSEVTSEAVDYRYAVHQVGVAAALRPVTHANDVAAQCVLLSRGLALVFSGIDLLMGDDGRVLCLEVNPSSSFTYFEDQTGQPIADAVARHLIAHDVAARS